MLAARNLDRLERDRQWLRVRHGDLLRRAPESRRIDLQDVLPAGTCGNVNVPSAPVRVVRSADGGGIFIPGKNVNFAASCTRRGAAALMIWPKVGLVMLPSTAPGP